MDSSIYALHSFCEISVLQLCVAKLISKGILRLFSIKNKKVLKTHFTKCIGLLWLTCHYPALNWKARNWNNINIETFQHFKRLIQWTFENKTIFVILKQCTCFIYVSQCINLLLIIHQGKTENKGQRKQRTEWKN